MNKIVGIGAVVMDTLISVPEYPAEDTKMCALEVRQAGGGPTATGIVAAQKLGIDCAYIGVLATDPGGQFLKKDFEKYGVDTSLIEIKDGYRSFTSVIWLSQAATTRTCVFDRGNLPKLVLNEAQKKAIQDAEILMVDGNELEAAIEGAKIARENGTKVLYDAGGQYKGVERLLPYADILIPSKEFSLGITGAKTTEEAAQKLYETYQPEIVVITCGKAGGILYNGSEYIHYPIYPAEVKDSNGAGDVFHGAFACGMVRGFGYEQCCHFSSAVSGIKCMGIGARESVPDYKTVIEYLRRYHYEL